MEKAILQTLVYSDIFNFPLKAYEIHKWLVKKETSLYEVEQGLKRLLKKNKIETSKDYYYLMDRKSIVKKRIDKTKRADTEFFKARIFSHLLKIIPWVKLVGVSGGLAMGDWKKTDDIDLFIITSSNRIWLTRFWANLMLDGLYLRRKRNMKKSATGGKLCLNLFVDEGHLIQEKTDLYTAHEVLQMRVLWNREDVYSKFLDENSWVFEYLPNWISIEKISVNDYKKVKVKKSKKVKTTKIGNVWIGDIFENMAKKVQLNIMKQTSGLERIEEGGLYFHPQDYREQILKEFKSRMRILG